MAIDGLLQQCRLALQDEVKAIRIGGGQRTYVNDGRLLGQRLGQWVYSFTADTELRLADDTRVDVEVRGRKYPATLVSLHGFDLILAVAGDLGEEVPTAVLYTEPWFLLEELQNRLVELANKPAASLALPAALVATTGPPGKSDLQQARALLDSVSSDRRPLRANDDQLEAVGRVLANPISFIWGPPGTGKTQTLGCTAAALIAIGQSVLILAHSNAAVDVAMLQVARSLEHHSTYQSGQVLRFGLTYLEGLDDFPLIQARGVVHIQNPALVSAIEQLEKERDRLVRRTRQEHLLPGEGERLTRELERVKGALDARRQVLADKEVELVRNARLLGCTFSKATIAAEIYGRRFDSVLIDEASMAYIPHCLFGAGLATGRVAVFGDFRQLAPIAQADTAQVRNWLSRDIFDLAGVIEQVNRGKTEPRTTLLRMQYRMHPDIARVPNRLFYLGQLKDAPDIAEMTAPIVAGLPEPGYPLIFLDVAALGASCVAETQAHSRFNLLSALVVTEVAYYANQSDGRPIGIITPYGAQARLIHRLLRDMNIESRTIDAATVHRFQGDERDLIVFDVVDGMPMQPGLPFTANDDSANRLVNVAVSRARGKFILAADTSYVKSRFVTNTALRRLLDAIEADGTGRQVVWPKVDQGFVGTSLPGIACLANTARLKNQIEADLDGATAEIAVVWQSDLKPPFSPYALLNGRANVRFFISGIGIKHFQIGLKNARLWEAAGQTAIAVVGIDRRRLWAIWPDPAEQWRAVRIDLPETVKLLYSFFHLVPDEELRLMTPEAALAAGKSPVGIPCPLCGNPLWPATSRTGIHLACTSTTCGYTKLMQPADATNLARLMGLTCPKCGGQVVGKGTASSLFLGCANFPQCRFAMSISDLI